MKKLLLIASLLLCAVAVKAAQVTALRVTLNDGKTQTFALDQQPKIHFEGADVVIATDNVSAQYARAEVKSMNFVKQEGGVGDIVADSDETVYAWDGTVFACPGQRITVYTLGGTVYADAVGSVSFADAPKGLYLVSVNSQTIKILR